MVWPWTRIWDRQGHWNWRHLITHTTSYWSAIVSIALSRTIFEINRNIGRKSQFIITRALGSPMRGPVEMLPWFLIWKKTRMVKKFDDMSSRLGTILCDRQTDTRDSIHSALCIASCGKTCIDMVTKLSKNGQWLWHRAVRFARWQHPAMELRVSIDASATACFKSFRYFLQLHRVVKSH